MFKVLVISINVYYKVHVLEILIPRTQILPRVVYFDTLGTIYSLTCLICCAVSHLLNSGAPGRSTHGHGYFCGDFWAAQGQGYRSW